MNQLLKLLWLFLFIILLAIAVVMFDNLVGFYYLGPAHKIILHNIGAMIQGVLSYLVLDKVFFKKEE